MRSGANSLSVVLVTAVFAVTACVGTEQRVSGPNPLPTMPSAIKLTAEQRNQIASHFDPEAVEKIANLLNGDERHSFLAGLGIAGEPSTVRGGNRVSYMMTHPDPRIQKLLEEMWVPFWDQFPPDALNDSHYSGFPGRKLAQERRLAREQGGKP
jgi:hypothetical protein